MNVRHSFILSRTYIYNWLRDYTSWASSGIGVNINSVLKKFWSLVLNFTAPRYTLLFLYSKTYITHVINCEWSRFVNFLLHMYLSNCNDMLTLLALCHPFGSPCLFVSLHACLHVNAWVLVLAFVIKRNSYHLMRVHTRPWYTKPWVLFRNFAWWHVCRPYSNLMELWTPDPNLHLSS